jgi:arachidonate 15-lipoxygenase
METDVRQRLLPTRHDQDPKQVERSAAIALNRDSYRFVHDWPVEVATNSVLPSEQDYGAAYIEKSLPVYAAIAGNYALLASELSLELVGDAVGDRMRSFLHGDHHAAFRTHIFQAVRNQLDHFNDTPPKRLEDYQAFFQALPQPAIVPHINQLNTLGDAIAWQRIAGCNPTVLTRCDRIPPHFPVTPAHYQVAMGSDDNLEAAAREGRLFMADYAILAGVECGVTHGLQKYLAAPIALYAVDRVERRLRSVCVQTGQDPSAYPIVTPADGWLWRMANLCVQVADANHHEASAHLGRTHLVMEAVVVAMKNSLAPNHPVAVMLAAHTRTTLAINHSAKTDLIAPGGIVDSTFAPNIREFGRLVRSALLGYPLAEANPRSDLGARGLLDKKILPEHPYRDDALPLWDALFEYLSEYVSLYFPTDADVGDDQELQAFVRLLSAPQGGRLAGVPMVQTTQSLAQLLTTLVFIATAQHSAVNFSQYDHMSYSPNMGGALYAPVPTASTPNTEAAYMALLTPRKVAINSASFVYLLSHVRVSRLGDYAAGTFTDPHVEPILSRFHDRLLVLEEDSKARDAGRFLSYPYLRPSQILQSISI